MIDVKDLREAPDKYRKGAMDKGKDPKFIDEFLKVDSERSGALQNVESLRAKMNSATSKGKPSPEELKVLEDLKKQKQEAEEKLSQVEILWNEAMLKVPNPAHPKMPVGKSEDDNVVLSTWGEIPKFDFEPKDHVVLLQNLNCLDINSAVKVAGSRSYMLKNQAAQLEMALFQYASDFITSKGFDYFATPEMNRGEALVTSGHFNKPDDESEDVYSLRHDNLHLIGTAEIPLTSIHSGEILDIVSLPKKYAGFSHCFRREAGTYGKDAYGFYRVHQFSKLEQFILCEASEDESWAMFNEIQKNQAEFFESLGIPYRILGICTGDTGAKHWYQTDLEVWMPSRNSYGEAGSCSMFKDFQARRGNLKYKDRDGKIKVCYTLNNTLVATPRFLISLIENYQNADGSITIPKVLRPYMLGKEKIYISI